MIKNNNLNLLKIIMIYLIYFVYTNVFEILLNTIGVKNDVIILFVSDLCFFLGIVLYYRQTIRQGVCSFKKDYSLKEKIILILKWFLIITVVNIFGGIISDLIFGSNTPLDENTTSLRVIADISSLYTIFKALIFASVAEELLFKKAIRDVIQNDVLFCIVSSVIYATVNIMYTNITIFSIVDFIQYFIFSILLSYCYVKNKDNVFIIMVIKFVYALFPLTLMLLGVGA